MRLFDFFKKKKPSLDEETVDIAPLAAEEESSPGWEAITAAFERLYPEQTSPKHYGTLIKYMFGGPDPLDGISIYDAGDFWHFVSYGLSELYTKESEDVAYSGYGIELTFKLKKSGDNERDEEEIRGVCSNLQHLARYVFDTGNVILPNQYIYTQQTEGIDVEQVSSLTGFIALADDLVPEIETPFGQVTFICLVGASDSELRAIYNKETTVTAIAQALASQVTDYQRSSVL